MAIIYSYPTVNPVREDLVLGTDVSSSNKATKNFTIQSIIDLVTVATGDLQTVLDLGNVATGRDIDLTNNAFRGGNFVTTGGVSISGTTATGFTNVNSTAFTGTLATAAQPNVTSLGALTALVIDGPISGTNLITSSNLANAANDNVVSTLAIKTYVDNKVGLYDTLQEVLANGNTTGGTDIAVSAGDDITFTDTSKVLMGTTANDNLEIYNDSANSIVIDKSPGALKLQTSLLSVRNEADTTQTISASAAGAVELYHGGAKKIETLVGGAKVTGAFEATTSGTFASLINTGTYSDSSGDVGTAGQILSSTGSGTNWVTEVPLYNWSYEGTNIPSGTAMTVTDGTNITTTWDAANYDLTIATTGVPDGSGAANQVTYWSDNDTLTGAAGFTFAGGATGKVAIAGELEVGGVLTDGTFTGSAGTYTGYVSITSTDFVGALTGNASTATALAASGAIALTGDTTSTGGPYTYTSGGAISIATTIADTTVTGKVLTNLATPTSAAIAATDTILAAMAKLQGQINGIAGSLAFEGTWDASTGNPPSATPVNGQFWIVSVAGNTNLDGITDWLVGDWAIYVDNGAGTDAWQKLDQSNEVLGSGAAQKMAMWSGTVGDASQTLATGLIEQNAANNLITIGNSGSLLVEGNTTLGNADTDTTTVKGPAIFEETVRINEGISLGANTYGTAGQVLTSGGGSASVNTWTTPTTGTVTSVALTETGDALTITGSPITGSGTINIAGAGAPTDYINGELNLVAFPILDNYQYWVLSDGTNTTNITSTGTATFTGASGITVAESAGTITITGSAQPGTGTQYTLPVWSTTTSLGDSMVSQNAGGTALTVSGSITANTGSKITSSSVDTTFSIETTSGTTIFPILDFVSSHSSAGARIRVSGTDVISIDKSQNSTFANRVSAGESFNSVKDGANTVADGPFFALKNAAGTRQYLWQLDASNNIDYWYYNGSTWTQTISLLNNGGATFAGDINISGDMEVNQIEVGTSTSFMRISSNQIYKETNGSAGWMYITGSVVQLQGTGTGNVIVGSNSQTTSNKTLSVRCDSNSVSALAAMSHQTYYAGGATKQGGIYTGTQTINNATQTSIFTLTANALIFDVMLTCRSFATNYQPVYITKKYSVARTTGQTSPNYFKIIDSGPGVGTGGAPTRDFTVDFVGDSTTGLECKITGSGGTTHEIHYTIIIGNVTSESSLGVTGY